MASRLLLLALLVILVCTIDASNLGGRRLQGGSAGGGLGFSLGGGDGEASLRLIGNISYLNISGGGGAGGEASLNLFGNSSHVNIDDEASLNLIGNITHVNVSGGVFP
ncbi:hypothetical protein VNO77_43047 [Canavalia gladiata]|uniref:Uncharacterized protein n=1 Tax=Canavalia gladiata TaxID=3824 RepID=A0AAN9PPL4_CANGL